MIRAVSFALFVVLSYAIAAAQPTANPSVATSHRIYDVIRKGNKIGTDVIDIERQGDTTTVKTATTLSVKLMFVEVYHYRYQATEIWREGQLVSFNSQTNDNGIKHAISAAPMSRSLALDVDGVHLDLPKTAVPATLWTSADISKHVDLFDPNDGKRMTVSVVDLGEETVIVDGVPHKAHHFRIVGDFPRNLWFDGEKLARMQLIGSDSSVITSDLRNTSGKTE